MVSLVSSSSHCLPTWNQGPADRAHYAFNGLGKGRISCLSFPINKFSEISVIGTFVCFFTFLPGCIWTQKSGGRKLWNKTLQTKIYLLMPKELPNWIHQRTCWLNPGESRLAKLCELKPECHSKAKKDLLLFWNSMKTRIQTERMSMAEGFSSAGASRVVCEESPISVATDSPLQLIVQWKSSHLPRSAWFFCFGGIACFCVKLKSSECHFLWIVLIFPQDFIACIWPPCFYNQIHFIFSLSNHGLEPPLSHHWVTIESPFTAWVLNLSPTEGRKGMYAFTLASAMVAVRYSNANQVTPQQHCSLLCANLFRTMWDN